MMLKKSLPALLMLILGLGFITATNAQSTTGDVILDFHSYIEVLDTGRIGVTENIVISKASYSSIIHGIYRDIPNKYGGVLPVYKPLRVLNTIRNGVTEKFSVKKMQNGIRIYIGDPDITVPKGLHNYSITYETDNQLGYFDNSDELYWNVTGNGWVFPINRASVTVALPAGIPTSYVKAIGYSGPSGTSFQDTNVSFTKNLVNMNSTRQLKPGEGFTVAINWPKGYINRPGPYAAFLNSIHMDIPSLIGISMFLFTFVYYFLLWKRVGRDEGGVSFISVHFAPPKDISPAQVRFINNMGIVDNKCFSSAVLNMAINGYIKIIKDKKEYRLIQTEKSPEGLAGEEQIIYSQCFANIFKNNENINQPAHISFKLFSKEINIPIGIAFDEPGTFTISRKNFVIMESIQKDLDMYFKNLGSRYIIKNKKYLAHSILIVGLFTLAITAYSNYYNILNRDVALILLIEGFVYSTFIYSLAKSWINIFTTKKYYSAVPTLIFSLVILAVLFLSFFKLFLSTGLILPLSYIFTFLSLYIFNYALPRRTLIARQIQDKIEGFKMFLTSQESYIQGVPLELPAKFSMYEKYLPYAIALDVEPLWSKKFKDVMQEMSQSNTGVKSDWYSGALLTGGYSDFSLDSFSQSFSGAISAASVNPSSSSGTGGGGGSGGGGGGGGGGGW